MISSGDRVLDDAMLAASGYVDLDEAAKAIQFGIQAGRKMLEALDANDYKKREIQGKCLCQKGCEHRVTLKAPWKPDELARSAAHVMKVVDEMARLHAFVRGQPDSRPDFGGGNKDWMSLLTPEQFAQVEAWIEAAHARLG